MILKLTLRAGILFLLVIAFSCNLFNDDEPSKDNMQASGMQEPFGTFLIKLVEASWLGPAFTSVQGKMYDKPNPSAINWEEDVSSGSCRLFVPYAPFCEQGCGDSATCVDHGTCQSNAKPVAVGTVTLEGVKTDAGENTCSMDPEESNNYLKCKDTTIAYPPFEEGDRVTLTAEGTPTAAGFTLSAFGISPPNVLNDSITLIDGQPVILEWKAPKQEGQSTISVLVDVSHHGGSKGKIECDVPDMGKLTIAASLLDKLKALGMAGYPKIEITRISKGTTSNSVPAALVLESKVTKLVSIPGIVSCDYDSDCQEDDSCGEGCPEGQTCQDDLKCQ